MDLEGMLLTIIAGIVIAGFSAVIGFNNYDKALKNNQRYHAHQHMFKRKDETFNKLIEIFDDYFDILHITKVFGCEVEKFRGEGEYSDDDRVGLWVTVSDINVRFPDVVPDELEHRKLLSRDGRARKSHGALQHGLGGGARAYRCSGQRWGHEGEKWRSRRGRDLFRKGHYASPR